MVTAEGGGGGENRLKKRLRRADSEADVFSCEEQARWYGLYSMTRAQTRATRTFIVLCIDLETPMFPVYSLKVTDYEYHLGLGKDIRNCCPRASSIAMESRGKYEDVYKVIGRPHSNLRPKDALQGDSFS